MVNIRNHTSCQGLNLTDTINLITEKLYPKGMLVTASWKELNHITTHTKTPTLKVDVIALKLNVHKVIEQLVPWNFLHRTQAHSTVSVLFWWTQTVDTWDRSYHDDIITLQKRRSCWVTEFINLIIDWTVLFDISIARRHISLRLVKVIVRHKILYSIIWEKLLKLTVELTC